MNTHLLSGPSIHYWFQRHKNKPIRTTLSRSMVTRFRNLVTFRCCSIHTKSQISKNCPTENQWLDKHTHMLTFAEVLFLGLASDAVDPRHGFQVALTDRRWMQDRFRSPSQTHGEPSSTHEDASHSWHKHTHICFSCRSWHDKAKVMGAIPGKCMNW